MKKAILPYSLAVAALCLTCCLSCDKPKETEPEKEQAVTTTLLANDVTVQEGKTVSIGAATDSSAMVEPDVPLWIYMERSVLVLSEG